jgi:hypothetical protein
MIGLVKIEDDKKKITGIENVIQKRATKRTTDDSKFLSKETMTPFDIVELIRNVKIHNIAELQRKFINKTKTTHLQTAFSCFSMRKRERRRNANILSATSGSSIRFLGQALIRG